MVVVELTFTMTATVKTFRLNKYSKEPTIIHHTTMELIKNIEFSILVS